MQLSSAAAAKYRFTASYLGDANFAGSNAAAYAYQVTAAAAVITFSGPTTNYDQSFAAVATSTSPGAISHSVISGTANP